MSRLPTNPFLKMPSADFSLRRIERDGRDFIETMDQIDTSLLDDERERELDDITADLHGCGWGTD